MKWVKVAREFHEREGYWPAFGETQRRERGEEIEPKPEPHAPTRPSLPRKRRRPWK
jgi:hypothetical protein